MSRRVVRQPAKAWGRFSVRERYGPLFRTDEAPYDRLGRFREEGVMARRVLSVAAIAGLSVLLLAGGYRLGKDAALPGSDAGEVSTADAIGLVESDRVAEVKGYPGRADLALADGRRLPAESQSFFNLLNQHAVPFQAEYKMTARSRLVLWVGVVAAPLILMAVAVGFARPRTRGRDSRAAPSASYA
jgi:hypothetical protein